MADNERSRQRVDTRTRPPRPPSLIVNMASVNKSSEMSLSENDIPGAALLGRKPEELKNEELKFWLKCRGDSLKGLKTKAELVKRVNEYITCGKDKEIVDPDPNVLYTKRKLHNAAAGGSAVGDTTPGRVKVKFPSDGYGTSLERMPMFGPADMNRHIEDSGKQIANKSHHSVPTGLRKAKRFLDDEYLEDVECTSDQKYFYVIAKCCHSYKKNDPPHSLKVALCVVSGQVKSAFCSCVAGTVGYCNHVLALMFKLCKFSLYSCTKTTDSFEDHERDVACTSQLQRWHKKGGGSNIAPQPVMEVEVIKTKVNETKTGLGVKPLLYDARFVKKHNEDSEQKFKEELKKLDPNLGLAHMALEKPTEKKYVDTRFGRSQVGSFLSYQVALTEANFKALANLESVVRLPNNNKAVLTFPRFPLRDLGDELIIPDHVNADGKAFVESLKLDEDKINNVEVETRQQAKSESWKTERKYRFTASQFHLIAKRKKNHNTFAVKLMKPQEISKRYSDHGHKYEPIALQEYEKFMHHRGTPVKVFSSGFVVSKTFPIFGASPDAKVIDSGCADNFGLAEVKCPYKHFNVTPMEACSDSGFCMSKTSDTECTLKENHPYYFQVQGQMGVTGVKWCDFIVYTNKGLYVQRIPFNPQFWRQLKEDLEKYYFEHFLLFALEEQSQVSSSDNVSLD